MPKRITYLEKRDTMPREDFAVHWSTTHADIARDLPGVTAYRQNHVRPLASPSQAGAYAVDGIVELWFGDESVVHAAFDSDVARRLAADEPNFLSGLTGGPVSADDPYQPSPHKLWLLARWCSDTSADHDAVTAWANLLAADWSAALNTSVNFLQPGARLLTRKVLRSESRIPQVAIAFGFAEGQAAADAAAAIADDFGQIHGVLDDIYVYLAEERVII
ncbi:EthD family reductase [Arthrobacter globiformis]|uniref:EthD family reductase n=1 Tax=Arthrobacter globiformis TaxID=1665 RepID=UPI0039795054